MLVWESLCITAIAAVKYLSIRYTERLAEAGAVCSIGSRGDSYDNALAETIIGLFKTKADSQPLSVPVLNYP